MIRLAGATFVVLFACACQDRPKIVQPRAPARDMVVLLPDPETQTLGRAVVSTPTGGSVELTDERETTRVMIGQPPSAPFTLSEAQIQQLFGDAFAARPPAPRHFILYFESGLTQLTAESERLITEILDFVRSRPAPDVTVVGHTDTTGTPQRNIELGLSRANIVRNRLLATGVDGSIISVASFGEAVLLVPTPDNTPEAGNRRVEVSVR
jgi:outer membrane protein OmpA-like peptidoglycan-associated protein